MELREDAGVLWLAIDYEDDVHGDCERVFRWDANVPGFEGQSRTTSFASQKLGSPPVRRQRAEFKLPDFLDRAGAQQFRDEVAKALVTQSVVARVGEDQPVFKLPLGDRGTLGASVGARLRAPSP